MEAPKAKKVNKELIHHGDVRVDPYYWMNQRTDQKVLDYLSAENAYTDHQLAPTIAHQNTLFDEIVGRIKQTDLSVPYFSNGYYYLTRYQSGQEHPIYARRVESLDGAESILLDVNQLAEPHDYYQIGGLAVSPDNKVLAYSEDTVSRRIYTIRFKMLVDGQLLDDQIENTTGQAVWANDNKTVFYTRKDETLRAFKIFKHVIGTASDLDEEIYHETDDTFNAIVYKSKSGQYIIIASYATLSTEFRLLSADSPNGTFQIFAVREEKHEYYIDHHDDRFIIRTNWEANNFRLMETPKLQTAKLHWTPLVKHRATVLLEDVEVFRDYLVLSERSNGLTQLQVLPFKGTSYQIPFSEEAYTVGTSINRDFESAVLRFGYSSLTTPMTTYDFDLKTKEQTWLKQQEVVGDFEASDYQSERLLALANDGTKVPISLVYKKGFKKDGTQPLLIYGYGSYGHSIDPSFGSARLSLLDRGFAFAIAHIRGGQELGRQWYEDGKFLKKKNTFTDFIACTQHLQQLNYCSPRTTYALGGSAGGLLMGAVINTAPELYHGVIAAVPFVDVVTTMLDESIPLTTGEYDEWGNPNDPMYYHYMKSYSPYDNVRSVNYPALLITTGLHDSQVQYWEPAKWIAKMRDLKKGDALLLLHTNMETGHSGASGRFKRHRETALEYAFLLFLAGKI